MTNPFLTQKPEFDSPVKKSDSSNKLLLPLLTSLAGYAGFEYYVENNPQNAAAIESVTGINQTILHDQGPDFFTAPFLSYALGTMGTTCLMIASRAFGMNKAARFLDKNETLFQTAIGFSYLGAREYYQAGGDLSKFDLADMAACGLGIATFCHGRDIAHFFKETASHIFKNKSNSPSDQKPGQELTP